MRPPPDRPTDAKALTYTTPPLEAAVNVVGHPVAHVWLRSDAPDLDVFAYLEEVDGNGNSTMAVNLRGTFLTCKAFLPGMLRLQSATEGRKRGVIVNMTSTDAVPFLSAYLASKRGIAGFSESLAAEVRPQGVRVIAFTRRRASPATRPFWPR